MMRVFQSITGLLCIFVCSTVTVGCATAQQDETEWGGLVVHQTGAALKEASHVIILMHGFGAAGDDLVSLNASIDAPNNTCFVFPEAPHKLERGGRAWVAKRGDYLDSRTKIVELLKYVKQENADARVILGGFSQGAILASNFVETDAELVDALILLSPSGQLRGNVTGDSTHKPLVFLAHGREDTILNFAGSEMLNKKLVELGYEVEWLPFDGAHNIPQEVIAGASKFLSAKFGE